jgi:hypothetical protein
VRSWRAGGGNKTPPRHQLGGSAVVGSFVALDGGVAEEARTRGFAAPAFAGCAFSRGYGEQATGALRYGRCQARVHAEIGPDLIAPGAISPRSSQRATARVEGKWRLIPDLIKTRPVSTSLNAGVAEEARTGGFAASASGCAGVETRRLRRRNELRGAAGTIARGVAGAGLEPATPAL